MGQLPIEDENKYYTTKLVNQIGDFSKYLSKKISNGEEFSSLDRETLTTLYNANKSLKESLQNIINNMDEDYSFSSLSNGKKGDIIINNFSELQNVSVEYPELIYDGPFSDGKNQREVKGLNGATVTESEALDIFNSTFSGMNLENVESQGEAFGEIECYCVQGEKDGEILYAQISKLGGKLITFSYSGSCRELNYDSDYITKKAQDFLARLELNDLKPVWINLANNVYTINFAYTINDVIVYSDLIKVRLCAETGMVIGIEAESYYINHTERIVDSPAISENKARSFVSDKIDIQTARLSIVPIGFYSEKLCYEFSGEYEGSQYFVYIDAINGKQVEMFKVIESTEGTLLI